MPKINNSRRGSRHRHYGEHNRRVTNAFHGGSCSINKAEREIYCVEYDHLRGFQYWIERVSVGLLHQQRGD